MKLSPFLVGALAHLATCATFAGKQDGYAEFIEKSGRGPVFGHAMREQAAVKPGRIVADTGIGEGKFWRQDPESGNVEEVSHLIEKLGPEDKEKLEHYKELWAQEEENMKIPPITPEEEARARRTIAGWENPKAIGKRSAAVKLGGREFTKEEFYALQSEVVAEFGEMDVGDATAAAGGGGGSGESTGLVTRQTDPFSGMLLVMAIPVVLAAAGAVILGAGLIGGLAGGIAAVISAHKKHRRNKKEDQIYGKESKKDRKNRHKQEKEEKKEKKKEEKEKKKEEKGGGLDGGFDKRMPDGATVWKTDGKDTPIVSMTEMESAAAEDGE